MPRGRRGPVWISTGAFVGDDSTVRVAARVSSNVALGDALGVARATSIMTVIAVVVNRENVFIFMR